MLRPLARPLFTRSTVDITIDLLHPLSNVETTSEITNDTFIPVDVTIDMLHTLSNVENTSETTNDTFIPVTLLLTGYTH